VVSGWDVVLVAGLVFLSIGALRDMRRSEADKGPGNGPFNGTFRPVSLSGLRRGLPWYVVGGLLIALAAWGA
jgi:hypothetical protein